MLNSICSAQPFLLNDKTPVKFEKLSVDEGLSQSSVFSVCQDKRGFLWIGTLDGLNKYDGYRFTLYESESNNPYSLSNNTIFVIYEDRLGTLWIGTLGGGLNRFDREKERFVRYQNDPLNRYSLSNDYVRSIYEDKEGNLWIGTNNGLNLLNRQTGRFSRYLHNPADKYSISNNYVWSIFEDSYGTLWVGTYQGLNRLERSTGRFRSFENNPNDPGSLSNNYVWRVFEDHKRRLWIGTSNGLNLLDRKTGKFRRFLNVPGDSFSISHNNIWSIYEDINKGLWIGTLGGGLDRMAETGNGNFRFINYSPSVSNPYSISHHYIWSIYQDKSGVMWIGTDIGLNKYDREKEKFRLFRNDPFKKNSLSSSEVTAVLEDRNGMLWIGTRSGLNCYDKKTQSYTIYRNDPHNPHSLSSNYVRALYEDGKGRLWIGTNGGGLNQLDRKTHRFSHYKSGPAPKTLGDNNVTCIHEDNNGILWVGTLSGLNRFDPAKNQFTYYKYNQFSSSSLSHDYIYCITEDNDGVLWIGTLGGGLNRFDPKTGKFVRFKNDTHDPGSLSNNYVWTIYEDPSGNKDILWIGTNDGLNRFDKKAGKFTVFRSAQGLVNNVVYGILKDRGGNLWISSNKGLSRFNPAKKRSQNYTPGDGLQGFQFNGGASYMSRSGQMFFGGINGLNAFYPDSIRDNKYVPPVVITDFQLFNRPVAISGDSPLKKSITETDRIELNYNQSVFSFEFAALHFASPGENNYAYKLEGFDRNWINAGTRRYVTYTNLDPGEYTFRVIASNNDGVWNYNGASVKLIIHPPFWKTWWFITITGLVLSGIITGLIYFRMHHLLTIERLRLKIARDLHDDIGTRLTEISMLSDMTYHIWDNTDPAKSRESVKKTGLIARALIDSMSEIVWLINPKRDTLYELFIKLRDSYEDILSYSQILLHINNLNFLKKTKLPMEYRKNVYLIFKEAMNNSLKYSKCTEISINTELKGRLLEITLYDNGKGFDMNKSTLGNGLENMKKRAESIGGNLRINSKPGEGTMIKFTGRCS